MTVKCSNGKCRRAASDGFKLCAACRASHRRYQKSEKGRAAVAAALQKFYKTEKGKALMQRYRESPKGIAARKRYDESEKGRAGNRARSRAWREQGGKNQPEKEQSLEDRVRAEALAAVLEDTANLDLEKVKRLTR